MCILVEHALKLSILFQKAIQMDKEVLSRLSDSSTEQEVRDYLEQHITAVDEERCQLQNKIDLIQKKLEQEIRSQMPEPLDSEVNLFSNAQAEYKVLVIYRIMLSSQKR